ncbi:MAG: hypothetical protein ACXWGV_10870 [Solirubrobacterales bacterium]
MAEREIRELMEEVREEHRLNRVAYQQQLDLTRTVVQRNAEAFQGLMAALDRFSERIDAFGERIDAFGERVDAFGERVDAFGATLEIQREILLRFLDRLDERLPPQG